MATQVDADASSLSLPSTTKGPWVHTPTDLQNGFECGNDVGKWLLYYDNDEMDTAWTRAVRAYNEGTLVGVLGMKASTIQCNNPRASTTTEGVIIFYCQNSGDEVHVMHAGQIITQVLGYRRRPSIYTPYVYYKTDTQTRVGTAATGVKKNYTYRLSVPTRNQQEAYAQ